MRGKHGTPPLLELSGERMGKVGIGMLRKFGIRLV